MKKYVSGLQRMVIYRSSNGRGRTAVHRIGLWIWLPCTDHLTKRRIKKGEQGEGVLSAGSDWTANFSLSNRPSTPSPSPPFGWEPHRNSAHTRSVMLQGSSLELDSEMVSSLHGSAHYRRRVVTEAVLRVAPSVASRSQLESQWLSSSLPLTSSHAIVHSLGWKPSVAFVMVVLVLFCTLATALSVWGVMYAYNDRNVESLTSKVQYSVNQGVTNSIKSLYSQKILYLVLTAERSRLGEFDRTNFNETLTNLWSYARQFVGAVYFGTGSCIPLLSFFLTFGFVQGLQLAISSALQSLRTILPCLSRLHRVCLDI